jgi:hypothetical protein
VLSVLDTFVRQDRHAFEMEHPKDVGDRSTLAVMLALRARGYGVYTPFGENTRCDLIIEDGETLSRVQCKTGRLLSGAIAFPTCSSYLHHPHPKISHRNYIGEVDYFGVFCQQTGGVYLVPIEDLPKRQAMLRVEPARNSQRRFIREAAQYEIASLRLATAGLGVRAGGSGSSA